MAKSRKIHPLLKDGRKLVYLKVVYAGVQPSETAAFSRAVADRLVREGKAMDVDTERQPIVPDEPPKTDAKKHPSKQVESTSEFDASKSPFVVDQLPEVVATALQKVGILEPAGLVQHVAAGNKLDAIDGLTPGHIQKLTDLYLKPQE